MACFISIQDVLTPRDEPLQQDKVKGRVCKRKKKRKRKRSQPSQAWSAYTSGRLDYLGTKVTPCTVHALCQLVPVTPVGQVSTLSLYTSCLVMFLGREALPCRNG